MSVPRAVSLRSGVAVNIVLKQDQTSGKLTTGKIKDVLTHGDHHRGIKVRLEDGQIGRVQSLVTGTMPIQGDLQSLPNFKFQEDVRNQSQPPPSTEASLGDYIKIKPIKKGKSKKPDAQDGSNQATSLPEQDLQSSLEKEFPFLDSSLIAAMLSDFGDGDVTRSALLALSGSDG